MLYEADGVDKSDKLERIESIEELEEIEEIEEIGRLEHIKYSDRARNPFYSVLGYFQSKTRPE